MKFDFDFGQLVSEKRMFKCVDDRGQLTKEAYL